MLFESFWSALGRNWRSPFVAAWALMQGKAALKRYLADAAAVDVTRLPYDAAVIDYITAWRARGGENGPCDRVG